MTPSSSSSHPPYECKYDVFISFRGLDTRWGFTGHLYDALCRNGIKVFWDDEELEKGEEITPALDKAIRESRIAIVIFSNDYASSTWCLDELAKVMEYSNDKAKGMFVLPVFYIVTPSDVRYQKGSYAEAFAKHEARFTHEKWKIDRWRLALSKAANLSGWHFILGQMYEHKFIGEVVRSVSKKISKLPDGDKSIGQHDSVPLVKESNNEYPNRSAKSKSIFIINGATESLEHDLRLREANSSGHASHFERFPEGAATSMVGFQGEHMNGNMYNGNNSSSFPGCVERLVRGRELRKISRASLSNESPDNNNNDNNNSIIINGVTESLEHDLPLREANSSGHASHFERLHMNGNMYNGNNSSSFPGRAERLVRERELRKISRASLSNESPDNNNNDNNNSIIINGVTESLEHDLRLREASSSGHASHFERFLEGAAAARALTDGYEREDAKPFRQRLLVVTNRLPVSAIRKGEDSWSLETRAGGLVSVLLGVKVFEARWIGWAGVNVPDEIGQKALTKALAEKRCIPVFLDEEIVHQYYNGYCNNILWPLFHYLGLPQEDRLATTLSFQSQFAAYQKANQMFADVVNEHYEEGDVVWCHDYHLMFLPQCLKNHNSKMKVGWFLHTPFPSSEINRTLPSRSDLLHAVLAADLVGFHTYDYARDFVSACTQILGLEGTPEGVEDQGKLTRVAAFPIGIDSERFIRALDLPQVQEHIKELQERIKGRKVMLGLDRLDTIKGIPHKILAFEKFLEENVYWRHKVVLFQITKMDVPEYQKLASQVHEIIGRVNGRFGTLSAVPIHHLDISLDFHALCALYAVTDIALVTSLRDGMNLVGYEFVACQDKKKGVLILSEFAGAAQSLGAGAILVNPWNVTEVAAAIAKALNMPSAEREKRHRHNFHHVKTHTAQEWAEIFVSELNDTVVEAQLRTKQVPPRLPTKTAIERYLQSTNRLLILGFNGTLTDPVERKGDQYKEMGPTVHPELKQPLIELCHDSKTTVVVLSGSGRTVLDENFKEYDMWLAAENGMFLNPSKGEWMTTMPEQLNMEWVDSVKHVFEYFTEKTPRSHFEEKEASLVWNYKHANVEFGRLQARDMLQHLWTGPISNAPVEVVQGSRSVEVRAAGATKGAGIDRILGEIVHNKSMTTPIDYVLCVGHFLTKDEDIYAFFEPEHPSIGVCLPRSKVTDRAKFTGEKKQTNHSWNVLDLKKENYFSCAVGRTQTNARYTLGSSDDVVSFLKELAAASSNSSF